MNHEFCEKCHANDFHIGYPCDPECLRRVEEERRSIMAAREEKKRKLEAAGIGYIEVPIAENSDWTELIEMRYR